jgi:hypothetical protein
MQGFGVVGIEGEGLPVARFRLGQAALLVEFDVRLEHRSWAVFRGPWIAHGAVVME